MAALGRRAGLRVSADAGPMARRLLRLRRRILSTGRSIVWLRALPGSGKSRLLSRLQCHAAFAREWVFLDEPDAMALEPVLSTVGCNAEPSQYRLLTASRATGATAMALLKPAIYGQVDVIDEQELFLTAADCRSPECTALLRATGGWPLLVDGYLAGRSSETTQMLPAFLERDVLPQLPRPVITALFASLPAPLNRKAAKHLFASAQLHPLLRATRSGVTVAGSWVRDALSMLSVGPNALQRAVLDDIVQLHARFAEPARVVIALLDLGRYARAVDVFDAAGGMLFGCRHGYRALERVLDRFGAEGERRTESVFLARLHLLMKSGRSREALLRLDAQYAGLPLDLRRLRVSHRPYALLMRLDLSLDLDESPPADVISSWGRLDAYLPPGDDMARGILYNTMAIGFLQAGALLQAQQFAEDALAVYRRIGSPYLAHFMLLHLCDLSLRRSRLSEAKRQLSEAQTALADSRLAFNSEPAIIQSFQARIAYEEGRFADCPEDIEPILDALLRGDSWADLISAMAAHFVFAAFWQRGLRVALDRLEQCALTLNRRHGALQNRRIELIRIRLYQMARRHGEAAARLEEFDLDIRDRRTPALQVEESLIRLRDEIARGRPPAVALKLAGRLGARTGLEARHRIALSILQAHLHHRAGETGMARRHLIRALRAARGDLLAALIEDGESLEKVLPLFLASPGPGNESLTVFAQRVGRLLRNLPASPLHAKALAGVTRREHRVLSYVADNYTNKQIARALGSSESAVKFHLRNLFRKMQVSSRAALRLEAEERGMHT